MVPSGLEAALDALRGRTLSDAELEHASVELARMLLARANEGRSRAERKQQELLARLMHDQAGQTFTTCLTDRVYRSRDPALVVDVARQLLRTLGVPRYLPADARAQLQ